MAVPLVKGMVCQQHLINLEVAIKSHGRSSVVISIG